MTQILKEYLQKIMGRTCRICKSNLQLGLFALPTDETLRNKWIESAGLELPSSLTKSQLKQLTICYKHFQKDDLFFNEKRSRYEHIQGKSHLKF